MARRSISIAALAVSVTAAAGLLAAGVLVASRDGDPDTNREEAASTGKRTTEDCPPVSTGPPAGPDRPSRFQASGHRIAAEVSASGVAELQVLDADIAVTGITLEAAGRTYDRGVLELRGDARLAGSAFTVSGPVTVEGGEAHLLADARSGSGTNLTFYEPARVEASEVWYWADHRDHTAWREEDEPATRPGAVRLDGAVSVRRHGDGGIYGPVSGRWVDPPPSLRVTDWRVMVEGNATVETGSSHGTSDEAELHLPRNTGPENQWEATLDPVNGVVSGAVGLDQWYSEGIAQLPATIHISAPQVIERRPLVVESFQWTVRNEAPFTLQIVCIAGTGPASPWASIDLKAHLHKRISGDVTTVGGRTPGLGRSPGEPTFLGYDNDDLGPEIPGLGEVTTDVRIEVPDGVRPGRYPLTLTLHGNFEPVTVEVELTVVAPAS